MKTNPEKPSASGCLQPLLSEERSDEGKNLCGFVFLSSLDSFGKLAPYLQCSRGPFFYINKTPRNSVVGNTLRLYPVLLSGILMPVVTTEKKKQMTSDDLVTELVFLPGVRRVIFGGGTDRREFQLGSGPGDIYGPDLPTLRCLMTQLEDALSDKGPVTVLHAPEPGKQLDDGVFLDPDQLAYQFEPLDGEWVQVDPKKVKRRFRLAGVPCKYRYEKLRR